LLASPLFQNADCLWSKIGNLRQENSALPARFHEKGQDWLCSGQFCIAARKHFFSEKLYFFLAFRFSFDKKSIEIWKRLHVKRLTCKLFHEMPYQIWDKACSSRCRPFSVLLACQGSGQ
jgi:hypothetical protein